MARLYACIAMALAFTASALAVGCEIATPQKHLKVGKVEEIEFLNCKGSGNLKLRYGNPKNLSEDKTLACANIQFTSSSVKCEFTPTRAGVFSLSIVDASGIETYTNTFTVDPAPTPEATKAQVNVKSTGVVPQQKLPALANAALESLNVHRIEVASIRKAAAGGSATAKRTLYEMTRLLAL
ncbi:hypothetical protein FBU30_010016 [Linnemannia zychae]|nr:hypothetical protein FBU30_010016 [Linnemannia zychae]